MGNFTCSIKGKSIILRRNKYYGLQPLKTALLKYHWTWLFQTLRGNENSTVNDWMENAREMKFEFEITENLK